MGLKNWGRANQMWPHTLLRCWISCSWHKTLQQTHKVIRCKRMTRLISSIAISTESCASTTGSIVNVSGDMHYLLLTWDTLSSVGTSWTAWISLKLCSKIANGWLGDMKAHSLLRHYYDNSLSVTYWYSHIYTFTPLILIELNGQFFSFNYLA